MAHLVGINKGPVMDYTNDSGLDEHYRKWKKRVEVLFKGPLSTANDSVKCNYIIYWSGDHGMDLVDKWTNENKINDGNKDTIQTYCNQFEEYIHPQTNKLLAVVELKHLFQGSMSLEDFHTKALRLVKQVGYEGTAKDQVLRDTIITSEKIRAKIVKEGHEVTLNWVMEIARLEVSTQQHLDRMQETAKVNYVQYGKSTKNKKGKKSTQSGTGGGSYRGDRGHGTSSKPSGKGRKLPFPQNTCYRCGKGRHQKNQECKALDAVKVVAQRGTLRKSVLNLNIPHIH